jgi:hypothetical protein
MNGILGLLVFIGLMALITACFSAVLLLVQCALVALTVGVGGTFSSYVRENRRSVINMLKAAVIYRTFAIPGVIVIDLLAYALLSDSSLVTAWTEDDWVGWLGLGLLLAASVGQSCLISFWSKTKQLAWPHKRGLVMEAILSSYVCWIVVKSSFFC